jgi:hypothetical protein
MIYYVDGYTLQGNPWLTGGGYTVCDGQGHVVMRQQYDRAGFTNNEGEIRAIKYAARIAREADAMIANNRVALTWATTARRKARPDLRPLCERLVAMIAVKKLTLRWEPRATNLARHVNERLAKTVDRWGLVCRCPRLSVSAQMRASTLIV